MNIRRVLTFVSISMIASACSVNRQPPVREITEDSVLTDTRVFYGKCAIRLPGESAAEAGLVAGLAAAFIPAVVSNAFDQLSGALTELGQDKAFTATASTPLEISPVNGQTCIQIVRGSFLPMAPEVTSPTGYSPAGLEPFEASRFAELGMDGRPDILLEARVVPSSDGSAVTLLATYLDYKSPLSPLRAPDRQAVGVALTISFHGPGTAADDDAASTTSLVVGDVTPGSALKLPLPRVTADATDQGLLLGTLDRTDRSLMSPWFTNFAPTITQQDIETSASIPSKPVTLTATITETRYGSDLAKYLAGVVTSAQSAASEAITTALIPSERKAAELAALQTRLDNESNLAESLGLAEAARIDYCFTANTTADPAGQRDRITKSAELLKAQIAANLAAAQAGKDKPYGSSLLVKVGIAPPSEHPICQQ
jgi:hypothetical protein